MYNELKGKTAIVTGSSSGIGKAIAKRLAEEGMQVVVNYPHEEEEAQELVEEIKRNNGQAIAIQADVTKEEDIERLLKFAIGTFGDLDVWVNNAGREDSVQSHKMTLEEWQSVIDTNLTGTFLGAREAINYFLSRKKKGCIINISSVHEIIPRPSYAHYAASKAGIKLLTQTLAREYGPDGIRVNSIGPGAIETPINADNMSDPKKRKRDEEIIPLRRIGCPKEIANVAAWLASDESSYVTGTTIYADGGLLLYPSSDENL